MAFAVKAVIDKVARDMDLCARYLFVQRPYDGGTHLNDVRLVRPLMRDGKVFAWLPPSATGSMSRQCARHFTQGDRELSGASAFLRELMRGGRIQQDIVDISAPIRGVPQSNWGDLQINSTWRARCIGCSTNTARRRSCSARGAEGTRRETDARQYSAALPRHLSFDDFSNK